VYPGSLLYLVNMNNQQYFEANKALWDSRVIDHMQSDFYAMNAFRQGKTSLNPPELSILPDLNGKSLLHLQCHFGMDTLSLARMGARVTGVDLSTEAIAAAGKLRDECGLNGRFIACNVYDLPLHLDEQFDLVFSSYGTIGWLPDLDR
jgi:2-polyprenyl-3-methyl-5-hydroxy-6-metoxy-1,4-benzoquinol methylase